MKFYLDQTIYNIGLKLLSGQGIKNRIFKPFFKNIKTRNPIIKVQIGKFLIKVPFSHQLPFILQDFPCYSTNLPRIAKLVHEKYDDLHFIDIGANVGDSVALLRTEDEFPILCIEGDQYFYKILEENLVEFSDVFSVNSYVGEEDYVISAVSVELGGTAHISQNDKADSIIHFERLMTILEKYPKFLSSKMLKVDTDGFDNKILRGSIDFLKISKPVIFFEYDPFFLSQQNDDGLSIFDELSKVGYQNLLIYENNGELLISADINNKLLLQEIHHFYSGRKSFRYCDICLFHNDDSDLFSVVRQSELSFFEQSRR